MYKFIWQYYIVGHTVSSRCRPLVAIALFYHLKSFPECGKVLSLHYFHQDTVLTCITGVHTYK